MKKSPEILVALVLIALILVGVIAYVVGVPSYVKAPAVATTTPAVATSTSSTSVSVSSGFTKYTDPSNVYSFTYPTAFTLSSGTTGQTQEWMVSATTTGLALVKVVIPQSFEPKTNFGDAKFTVGTSEDPSAVADCLSAPQSGSPVQKINVTINGVAYVEYVTSDAGAGNIYETTSYRTVHGGTCYAIEYTIHSGNIQNYPTDSGITAFDKSKVTNVMESIVKSFAFAS